MQTLGQRLHHAREARHLSLAQAAELTRIRAQYLQALETDDYSAMPSAAQGRGFLRLYAGFLGLDVDEALADLRRAQSVPDALTGPGLPPPVAPEPPAKPVESVKPPSRKPEPKPVEAKSARPPKEKPAPPPEPAPARPAPDLPSARIFSEIGRSLRARRELISLSLDDIEAHTHVRRHYLQALEDGAFDQLPSPVQTRGMLSNYAAFLDMDVDGLLLRFAEGLQAQRLERLQPGGAEPRQRAIRLPFRTFLAGDIVFGLGMVVFIVVFGIWGIVRIARLQAQRVAESTLPLAAATATPSPTLSAELPESGTAAVDLAAPLAQNETPLAAPETGSTLPVQIYLVITERTFLRVTVDGDTQVDGRVLAGSAYTFEARERIEILTGNAAALRVVYNGRDLGLMGGFGQVSNLIYTVSGIQTPTSTPLPTSTATPRISPTPTRTQTPTPTKTGTPIP